MISNNYMVSKMHILHLILHFSKEKPRKLLINGVLTSFLEVSSGLEPLYTVLQTVA